MESLGRSPRERPRERTAMKKKIRHSATKKSKMSGFRTRNKTANGKKIISRKRRKGSTI